jgi:ribosomal protein L11 methyltransferase
VAWQRVDLVVEGARAEALADALAEAGAISTDISDADAGTPAETARFGEPGSEAAPWPRCRVSALFPGGEDAQRAVGAALADCGEPPVAAVTTSRLEDADWVARMQREFEPVRAGTRLWIVPTWHAAPDPDAVNVMLDPGAAFGTGSHPTTRLCLAWLERNVRPGDTVLDYGCGSGILAIAAMKLGAASARAVDIDPLALEAALYNARRNDVRVEVIDAHDGVHPGAGSVDGARITIANILANPLRMLAPTLATLTAAGGAIALSGILESQASEVAAGYAPWAALEVAGRDGDWVLLAGTKGPPAC